MNSKILDSIESVVPIGGSFKLYVRGFSMLPLLGYGRDHIVIRRTTADEPITGRIAMFRGPEGNIIVHRVLAVKEGVVTLQGDGNLYQKERCLRENIVGVVESVIRENGRVVSCTTKLWQLRERLWTMQPTIVRRYALAVIRRWHRWCKKSK